MSTYGKSFRDIPQETIVKFQALWRGYIYKQAFPFALAQAKERNRLIEREEQPSDYTWYVRYSYR